MECDHWVRSSVRVELVKLLMGIQVMGQARLERFAAVSASALLLSLLSSLSVVQAQQSVRMRVEWDNFPVRDDVPFWEIRMSICSSPSINFEQVTPRLRMCNEADILNEDVTTLRGIKLVKDKLKSGKPYKVCLIYKDLTSSRGGVASPRATCKDFVAKNNATVSISSSKAQVIPTR